jgi:hypothetical protein
MFTRCQQNCFSYQGFVSVFSMHLEYNKIQYKKSVHSSEPLTLNIPNLFAPLIFMPLWQTLLGGSNSNCSLIYGNKDWSVNTPTIKQLK